jgi:hypothetical protein
LAAPGAAQLHVGAEAGYGGGARDGRAVFERLSCALQADQAEVVQRGDAGVVDKKAQQVTLGGVANLRQGAAGAGGVRPSDVGCPGPFSRKFLSGSDLQLRRNSPHHALRESNKQASNPFATT